MKVWEAIEMLEQLDQNKEVTVTFGTATKTPSQNPAYKYVIGREDWKVQESKHWPFNGYDITCSKVH